MARIVDITRFNRTFIADSFGAALWAVRKLLLRSEVFIVRILRSILWAAIALSFLPLLRKLKPRPIKISVRVRQLGAVPEPEDLRSNNGVLRVDFSFRNIPDGHGGMRYCYLYKDGSQAPNLRVAPGDWLVLRLKNDLEPPASSAGGDSSATPGTHAMHMAASASAGGSDSCAGGAMGPWSTNLHFHGMTVPAKCHQDDVLKMLNIAPGGPPFEYRFQIPADEPPGVYWYHPHVHGFSNVQVQGGASGALIVEGIERANTLLARMPERMLIVRDQPLLNPDAAAVQGATCRTPPVTA